MTICVACKTVVTKTARNQGLQCVACQQYFHAKCAKLTNSGLEAILNGTVSWLCSNCKSKQRKSIISSDTKDSSTMRRSSVSEDNTNAAMSSSSSLINDIAEIKAMQQSFVNSMKFFSDSFDSFNIKIDQFDQKIKLVEKIIQENIELRKSVNVLTDKVEILEQKLNANFVDIVGVPEKSNENIIKIVQSIGVSIKCPLNATDLDDCFRVKYHANDDNKPKKIIVRFISRLKRNDFIASYRLQKNNLTTENLNLPAPHNKIYINEHLSQSKAKLLFESRTFCRNNGIKWIWVRDSNIFVRKADESKTIKISKLDDLRKVAGVALPTQ